MGRHANPDIRRAFAEFQDSETPSKCNKVRCLHCGYTRAKNTTRQIEHLQECQAYLASSDAQAHLAAQPSATPTDVVASQPQPSSQILNGQAPNPNLQVHRRGPNHKRPRDGQSLAPLPMRPQQAAPSLTAHLLSTCASNLTGATHQPFLSHAGCGSLAAGPLSQWLVQDGHYARGYIRFIGHLLAKIRLPQTQNSQFNIMYRTMDLLISALNNMRREMQFFEITATKYGLALGQEGPTPITRALLDLFVSASSSSASLLEGMVVLWGTEHCYRSAWQYASSFNNTLTNPTADSHIVALHQVLIPNWTSPAFYKFVDATRTLVDELANNSSCDGKEEMDRCTEIFKQICWLEERFWPVVNGMGEGAESTQDHAPFNGPMNQNMNGNGSSFNNPGLNGPLNGAMAAPPMTNQAMGNQIGTRNGPMVSNGMNGRQMNSAPLSASNGNADEEDDASADGDNSGSFGLDPVGHMAQMAQAS